jgi:threonine aldolase
MKQARDPNQVRRACTRFLGGHQRQTPRQILSALAETAGPDEWADMYGSGDLIANFEQEIAQTLGKEAAVFMPSGTMCQQIALRILTEQRQIPRVAFHPTCHLDTHEEMGYQRLHHLEGIRVGSPHQLIALSSLQALREPVGALLLELPQREIGGQLPTWEDLTTIIAWAREQKIATHMDGARLWECQPFYGRDYAEIASLFDTVYVSFYKGLGGIAGAMLAGPADVITQARVWQRRHGGNLVQLFPYVLSARQGFAERIERMASYHEKAKAIAAVCSSFPQIELIPDPPQTNMMHLYLHGEATKLAEAMLDIAEETGTWLLNFLAPTELPSYVKTELTIGDASMAIPTEEVAELFTLLFKKAGID